MRNISDYINESIDESILSSTNSGVYASANQLKELLINGGISEDKLTIKCTKKDPTPYAIIKGDKGYKHYYEDLRFNGISDTDIKTINNSYGVYFKKYGNLVSADIKFLNTNNIKLDLSNWNKAAGPSIHFSHCKNISIEALPVDSSGNASVKELFFDDSTVNTLPKDLGNTTISVNDGSEISLSKLKSLNFNEFEFLPELLGVKNYKPGKFQETFYDDDYSLLEPNRHFNNEPHKLKKEFNAKLKPFVDALKDVQISFLGETLVDYNKNTDTYIFMSKDWAFQYDEKWKSKYNPGA